MLAEDAVLLFCVLCSVFCGAAGRGRGRPGDHVSQLLLLGPRVLLVLREHVPGRLAPRPLERPVRVAARQLLRAMRRNDPKRRLNIEADARPQSPVLPVPCVTPTPTTPTPTPCLELLQLPYAPVAPLPRAPPPPLGHLRPPHARAPPPVLIWIAATFALALVARAQTPTLLASCVSKARTTGASSAVCPGAYPAARRSSASSARPRATPGPRATSGRSACPRACACPTRRVRPSLVQARAELRPAPAPARVELRAKLVPVPQLVLRLALRAPARPLLQGDVPLEPLVPPHERQLQERLTALYPARPVLPRVDPVRPVHRRCRPCNDAPCKDARENRPATVRPLNPHPCPHECSDLLIAATLRAVGGISVSRPRAFRLLPHAWTIVDDRL
ncbi:hypothetical protein FIBSPDRAFT_902213 [Athelia psychrophila]|uniref:Protein kinase domain-containing protein n=1 Tax=Athelia psychrophila TaxID=1759441 RepID=A0A167XIN1_9AGAM|nr:hypothetical protein FIBSPDRAFT_902213 [Fibularhizoctonia sp. CBS 109695]